MGGGNNSKAKIQEASKGYGLSTITGDPTKMFEKELELSCDTAYDHAISIKKYILRKITDKDKASTSDFEKIIEHKYNKSTWEAIANQEKIDVETPNNKGCPGCELKTIEAKITYLVQIYEEYQHCNALSILTQNEIKIIKEYFKEVKWGTHSKKYNGTTDTNLEVENKKDEN